MNTDTGKQSGEQLGRNTHLYHLPGHRLDNLVAEKVQISMLEYPLQYLHVYTITVHTH